MQPDRRRLRNAIVLVVLTVLSLACTVLLEYRMRQTGSQRYAFMTWNLTLAWIPVIAAYFADELARSRAAKVRALALPVAAVWLVFLPNAPYMATDLIHLTSVPYIPWWYDATMLLGFGGVGVLMGLASLLLMQDAVALHAGRRLSWLFAAVALVLTSFGVYLGRFERFNSWEVFSSPALVVEEVWLHLRNPFEYPHAFQFTLAIASLLLVAYIVLLLVTQRGLSLLTDRSKR